MLISTAYVIKCYLKVGLREKCSHAELFWPVFSRTWTEYGDILRISPYSIRMRENTEQNNSECDHFLRSVGKLVVVY